MRARAISSALKAAKSLSREAAEIAPGLDPDFGGRLAFFGRVRIGFRRDRRARATCSISTIDALAPSRRFGPAAVPSVWMRQNAANARSKTRRSAPGDAPAACGRCDTRRRARQVDMAAAPRRGRARVRGGRRRPARRSRRPKSSRLSSSRDDISAASRRRGAAGDGALEQLGAPCGRASASISSFALSTTPSVCFDRFGVERVAVERHERRRPVDASRRRRALCTARRRAAPEPSP